jgi:hypothetical protein
MFLSGKTFIKTIPESGMEIASFSFSSLGKEKI